MAPGQIRPEVKTVQEAMAYIFNSTAGLLESEWKLLADELFSLGEANFTANYAELWERGHGTETPFKNVIRAIKLWTAQRESASTFVKPTPSSWELGRVTLPCNHKTSRKNIDLDGAVCPFGCGRFSLDQIERGK